jgi:tetratricopeptide (TPR) repeat protein
VADHLTQERLDELWDFDDVSASERRIRSELLVWDPRSAVASELTTQLARARGLQWDFSECEQILNGIVSTDAIVLTRVLLELGRVLKSTGQTDAAIPLFVKALAASEGADDAGLSIDAAHMLALADRANAERWTARGLMIADEATDNRTKQWSISLHADLGWHFFERGALAEALEQFELAATAARSYGTPQQNVWAQNAIDKVRATISKLAD